VYSDPWKDQVQIQQNNYQTHNVEDDASEMQKAHYQSPKAGIFFEESKYPRPMLSSSKKPTLAANTI
jgi:hypothetical protein